MTQKEIAVQCLETLDVYKPYINKFKSKSGMTCFFENFAGFWTDQWPEMYEKVKEVERDYDCLVYAITHEFLEIGDCWTMLCVPKDTVNRLDVVSQAYDSMYYAYAYAWNRSIPEFSEFGSVIVRSYGGGIKRVS